MACGHLFVSLLVAPLSQPFCACLCVFAGYFCVSSSRFPLCLCIRQTSTRTDTVSVMRFWSCFFVPIVCACLPSPCVLFFLCVFVCCLFVFLQCFSWCPCVCVCVCLSVCLCRCVRVYVVFYVFVLSLPDGRQSGRQTAYLCAFL